jgi:hypothetical protein
MQTSIDFDQHYPPHQRHSETSKSSAAAAAPRFSERMWSCLGIIAMRRAGVTDEEGQQIMSLDGNSYRPLRVTLTKYGYIENAGIVRKTKSDRLAVAWQVTESGIQKLKEKLK